jgi:hypothetical protein
LLFRSFNLTFLFLFIPQGLHRQRVQI